MAHSGNGHQFALAPRVGMCLDFPNTLAYRGSTRSESLHSFADLVKWCGDASVLPASLAQHLRRWAEKHPQRATDLFIDAIALRELLYRIFHSLASGGLPDDADLDHLNRDLRNAPLRTAVCRSGKHFAWQIAEVKPSADLILAPVLWSAADLLVGPQLTRLRECSNDKCLWLFLDDSKNGTRRWCSMQACGNRAKAQRHYLRHKST